jgi:hypothetical protein
MAIGATSETRISSATRWLPTWISFWMKRNGSYPRLVRTRAVAAARPVSAEKKVRLTVR